MEPCYILQMGRISFLTRYPIFYIRNPTKPVQYPAYRISEARYQTRHPIPALLPLPDIRSISTKHSISSNSSYCAVWTLNPGSSLGATAATARVHSYCHSLLGLQDSRIRKQELVHYKFYNVIQCFVDPILDQFLVIPDPTLHKKTNPDQQL